MTMHRFVSATAFACLAALSSTASQAQSMPPTSVTLSSPSSGHSAEIAPGLIFEVTELRRMPDPGVLQLKFKVTNNSPNDATLKDRGLARNNRLYNIDLIDFASRKVYKIAEASACLCTTFPDYDGGPVPSGETREFWAWYGLPSGGVRAMSVQFPGRPPIVNVPIL